MIKGIVKMLNRKKEDFDRETVERKKYVEGFNNGVWHTLMHISNKVANGEDPMMVVSEMLDKYVEEL